MKDISFKALCVVTRDERDTGETTSELEWKDRVRDRVEREGYWRPLSSTVYKAIEAIKFVDRKTQRQVPVPPAAALSSVASLLPPPPSNACGCLKRVSGAKALRCTLPKGHDGGHALQRGGLVIARWGDR